MPYGGSLATTGNAERMPQSGVSNSRYSLVKMKRSMCGSVAAPSDDDFWIHVGVLAIVPAGTVVVSAKGTGVTETSSLDDGITGMDVVGCREEIDLASAGDSADCGADVHPAVSRTTQRRTQTDLKQQVFIDSGSTENMLNMIIIIGQALAD